MSNIDKKQYTLAKLVEGLDVTLRGDPDCVITGVSPIQQSSPGHVTFLTNPLYRKHLASTKASAVILSEADLQDCHVNAIVSRNPYYTYAKIARYFDQQPVQAGGIHPTAVIGQFCDIDPSASLGPYAVIGDHVKIGPQAVIGPHSTVGEGAAIGAETRLDAHVTIYHGVKIGQRCHISSGAVIGGDGFGFAQHQRTWHKVPQVGSVYIGDDVDIGANTSIDRGAIEDTVIENGVKLDNLIQIGHNVRVGADTVIAGCVAIAGSATIGKNCIIGGGAAIAGHISVADQVILTGHATVTKSITEPGMYSSGIVGAVPTDEFRKNNARFYRLEHLMQRVKNLESAIKEIRERKES